MVTATLDSAFDGLGGPSYVWFLQRWTQLNEGHAMNARLVVIKGAKPASIRLRLPTVIGRSDEATVKVPNSVVSRKHCEIYQNQGELLVRDLGSVNGTFVNNQRVSEAIPLSADDLLRVGPVVLRVVLGEPAEQDSPIASGAETPVTEEAADDSVPSASSSILSYTETGEGSFINIDEADDIDDVEPLSDARQANTPKVETGQEEPGKVDSGDSALGDFFKSLG